MADSKEFFAQGVLLEISKELLKAKDLFEIDDSDEDIDFESKLASRKALSFALGKIYEKFDELDEYKK